MPDFISSGWFISVVGGLLVTLTWETIRFFLDRKAYNRQVKLVRHDFSKIIKVIISEEAIPSMKVLESLLKGLAQKHNVKYKDVSKVDYIFYALVGNVMESNFLDYNQKIEFCEKLEHLSAKLIKQLQSTNDSIPVESNIFTKYKVLQFASVLSINSIGISLVLYFMGSNETLINLDRNTTEVLSENPINMLSMFLIIVTFFMAVMISMVYRQAVSSKKRALKEKE